MSVFGGAATNASQAGIGAADWSSCQTEKYADANEKGHLFTVM